MTDKNAGKSLAHLNKQIALIGTTGKNFEELVQSTAKACVVHANKYHDVTPMMHLVQTIQANIKGYVANELVRWFRTVSPVKFTYDEKDKTLILNAKEEKKANGELVRPYFTEEEMDKHTMVEQASVKRRTQNNIEPFSFKLIRDRVSGLMGQLEKAAESDGRGIFGGVDPTTQATIILHKGDPGFDAEYDRQRTYLQSISEFAKQVVPLKAPEGRSILIKGAATQPGRKTAEPAPAREGKEDGERNEWQAAG